MKRTVYFYYTMIREVEVPDNINLDDKDIEAQLFELEPEFPFYHFERGLYLDIIGMDVLDGEGNNIFHY